MAEFKPCPKCKKSKYKFSGRNIMLTEICYPKYFKKHIVQCTDCGLSTKRTFTKKASIKLWNKGVFDNG